MNSRLCAMCVSILSTAACTSSPPAVVPSSGGLDAKTRSEIDSVLAQWNRSDSPGCALAVVRDGVLVHAHGYGMANLEHAIPITTDTVFDIGSTSKQFTAACIGLLAEEGALSLDDDVRRWIPEIPDYGSPITLRNLLHHTSGLRDYLDLFVISGIRTEDWTSSEQALDIIARQKALNFAPGEAYSYSNTNYFLLARVVERASGTDIDAFAERRIFGPLEMRSTHFHTDHTRIVPGRATGHTIDSTGKLGIYMSDFEQTGDGALFTTVADLAKWDANFESKRIGGEFLHRFMHERGRLNDGQELSYASGLSIGQVQGLTVVDHGGAWAGYRSQMLRLPDERVTVICLSNLSSIDPSDVCWKVAARCLRTRLAPPSDDARPARAPVPTSDSPPQTPAASVDLDDYSGRYSSDELGAVLEIAVREGRVFIGRPGLVDFEIRARDKDRFGAYGATFEFARDDRDRVASFTISTPRTRGIEFDRIAASP